MALIQFIAHAAVLLQSVFAETRLVRRIEKPSGWEVLIINLARRRDRLERFIRTAHEKEPWLLVADAEKARGLCRIPGRDSHNLHLHHSRGNLRSGSSNSKHPDTVPLELTDSDTLLRDGWVTAQALDDATAVSSMWPTMTRGGIGLYLGHAAAWQHIIEHKLEYGLVVEDDLTLFAPSFKAQVSALLRGEQKPEIDPAISWDFLYLQRCDDKTWLKERVDLPKPTRSHNGSSGIVAIESGDVVTCTGAYIVTQHGAQLLLDGALPANQQLDMQLGAVPGLKRAALSPPVAQCGEVLDGGCRDTDVQKVDDAPEPSPAEKANAKKTPLSATAQNAENLMRAVREMSNSIRKPCDESDLVGHQDDGVSMAASVSDCKETV